MPYTARSGQLVSTGLIDNIRIACDTFATYVACVKRLTTILGLLNITVGEHNRDDPTAPYDFLGIHFSNNQVRVTDRLKQKMERDIAALMADSAQLAIADYLAIFGRLVYAARIVDFDLASIYYIFKFIRRVQRRALKAAHAGTKYPEIMATSVTLWPSIRGLWTRSLQQIVQTVRTFVPPDVISALRAVMFTDASNSGCAAVTFIRVGLVVRCVIVARRWSVREAKLHINVKELIAFQFGVRKSFQKREAEDPVWIFLTSYIDNTTALAWARNGRSNTYLANVVSMQTRTAAALRHVYFEELLYVSSQNNIADGPSRW
jgi:hypothetical protein